MGIISVSWFMYVGLERGVRGIFWDAHSSIPLLVLGYNLVGAFSIIFWSAFWSALVFGALNYFQLWRVSPEGDFKGMDLIKHRIPVCKAGTTWCRSCSSKS